MEPLLGQVRGMLFLRCRVKGLLMLYVQYACSMVVYVVLLLLNNMRYNSFV